MIIFLQIIDIDTEKEYGNGNSLKQSILRHIQNTQDVGYFESHPYIFRQPRILVIADNYHFVNDKKKEDFFLADTILGVDALAIVKCNFDFYKTKVSIKSITQTSGKTSDDAGYQITTNDEDKTIHFKLFHKPKRIDYPIKVLGCEGDLFRLYPNFSLPCIMSKHSFRKFILNYKDNKQLKLL